MYVSLFYVKGYITSINLCGYTNSKYFYLIENNSFNWIEIFYKKFTFLIKDSHKDLYKI